MEVRARRWLVESVNDTDRSLSIVSLSCIDDDAQGEQLSVVWDAEIAARPLHDDPWPQIARNGTDDAEAFAAFLRTATPHNGHSNSFSSLLEMLDPQRFTRGVPVRPAELDPVVVRRLKADLRELGESFPERQVEPIVLRGLPEDALRPEAGRTRAKR